jgi:hypothetical protein
VANPQMGLYEEYIKSLGSKIIYCELKPFSTYRHWLARILRENQYDVMHSHGWLFSGIILRTAHKCDIPILITYSHPTRDTYQRKLYRKLYSSLMI